MWDPSLLLPDSSQATFYWKAGNSCLSFAKNAFLYLSRHHYTSELYKHLGGTGSLVETFHSSTAPFLEQEASAQRSWLLGTAGLTVSHTLRGTPQWTQWLGKEISLHLFLWTQVWLPQKCASSPWLIFIHSRKHFQDPGMAKQMVLKEGFGSSLQPEGLWKFTASIVNAWEAHEVPDTTSKTLRSKLKNIWIHNSIQLQTHSTDEGEPSKHISSPHHNGPCSTKAIHLWSSCNSSVLNSAALFRKLRWPCAISFVNILLRMPLHTLSLQCMPHGNVVSHTV